MNIHRALLTGIIAAVLLGAALTIGQIWFSFMDWSAFIKSITTLGILVVIAGFLLVVGIDFGSNKKLKDENYLD